MRGSIKDVEIYKVLSNQVRLDIFNLLLQGPLSIEEIARKLGFSHHTIRLHLKDMESVGLIESYDVRGGVGKPKLYYKLAKSLPLITFPHRLYREFLEALLEKLLEMLGQAKFEKFFKDLGASMAESLMKKLKADYGVQKWDLETFKKVFVERYIAESTGNVKIEEDWPDKLVYRIYNCPFFEVAIKYPTIICDTLEDAHRIKIMKFLEPGLKFERTKCMAHNDPYCEFVCKTA